MKISSTDSPERKAYLRCSLILRDSAGVSSGCLEAQCRRSYAMANAEETTQPSTTVTNTPMRTKVTILVLVHSFLKEEVSIRSERVVIWEVMDQWFLSCLCKGLKRVDVDRCSDSSRAQCKAKLPAYCSLKIKQWAWWKTSGRWRMRSTIWARPIMSTNIQMTPNFFKRKWRLNRIKMMSKPWLMFPQRENN